MPTRFRGSATILRLGGLAVLVLGIGFAFPTAMQAAGHALTIGKECVSPKNSCGSNTDCTDPNSCNGLGVCTSSGANHMTECSILLINSDPSLDDVKVLSASDTISAFAGPQTFNNLPVSSTTGTVSGDCTGSIDPLIGCTLSPGASITFLSNQYVIQPTDPNPLPDQGTVLVQDLCTAGLIGCSTIPVALQAPASTNLVSGCTPGTPCTPTPIVNTPTNTPTTPTEVPPVPTLSFPMMAMLGLLLAGAGLFLARR
jgi:hypothetical protein